MDIWPLDSFGDISKEAKKTRILCDNFDMYGLGHLEVTYQVYER